jgi:drug/metabolite transporter (DMT)-like permease
MLQNYLGEASALLASVCFSIGPTFNTLAGKRVSVATLNLIRLLTALLLLIVLHWLTRGIPFPFNGQPENWIFMGLSGLFSLVIGDSLLFAAFAAIGTRLSMLIASLIPVFSSLLAWFLLDEKLTTFQATGVLVTITGVAWVVLDRSNGSGEVKDQKLYHRGLLLAFGAAFFHAVGAIASKKGLSSDFPAISAHMIRTLISLLLILVLILLQGQASRPILELRQEPGAIKFLFWGAFFGPLLGMWLSLLAIQNTNVGVATSLTSLPPVWLLLIGRYFFQEKIGMRAVVGSLVAVTGVAIIFIF